MSFFPRKPESVQWTAFPEELVSKIKEVFTQTYLKETQDKSFMIEGRIFQSEILLRVGLLTSGKLVQDNFESSIDLTTPKDNVHERIYICVDALGRCFDDYFALQGEEPEDEEESPLSLPYSRDWEEIDLDGVLLHVRYSSVNTLLEREADRILGTLDENLYKEAETVSDDALEKADVDTEAAKARQKQIRSEAGLH